nr:MAG TPA: hypothetical protein [Caudoviricetes sp.]
MEVKYSVNRVLCSIGVLLLLSLYRRCVRVLLGNLNLQCCLTADK